MAYYWVTQAQKYIQSLGFGSTLPAVNRRQQLVRIDRFGGDTAGRYSKKAEDAARAAFAAFGLA